MEDMCQLSERLTEYKYKGSYEQIAKIIMLHSSAPKLDVVSLRKGDYSLTPAYDLGLFGAENY